MEYTGKGTVRVDKDVLLSVPDDSIVPYSLEGLASAICVSGSYRGDNVLRMTICVSIILKVLARVEILIPSYGFCSITPCEEFADNVCDEFFSLPLFPPLNLCENGTVAGDTANNNCGCRNHCGSNTGCNACKPCCR